MKENSLEGYVYIATNPAYEGSVKIGHAGKIPALRLTALSQQTAIKDPFVNQWYVKVKSMKLGEQLLHYEFNDYRERTNKEYFKIDLVEAIAKSEKVLVDFFGSLEGRYCKLNLPLYNPNIVDTKDDLSNINEENVEWTRDITEYLSDRYEISSQIDGLFRNYNSEIVVYCIEVLRYIEQGYENFKLSEEKIELLSGLIEALDELPNVPRNGYNFDITLSEKGEYGSGNTAWSISINDSVFNVNKTISTYDKEIGSDWYSSYNYQQYIGCNYSSEGYAQEWYDDLLAILSGNHAGDLEIDINLQDE